MQQLAGVTLKRTQELIKKGFISAAQLDKDVSSMRTANASLASAATVSHRQMPALQKRWHGLLPFRAIWTI